MIAEVFSPGLKPPVENAIIPVACVPYYLARFPRGRGGKQQAVAMNDNEEVALREQLARLQQEHRDLDTAIDALVSSPGSDLIQVQRLKKRKLVLRDKIRQIEDQITPDIIA